MPDVPAPTRADPSRAAADAFCAPFTDTFSDDRPAGRVIGTRVPGGPRRGGRDADGVLAVDHGALRIGYFETPGWGRHGVAYGPFVRANGLALAVFVLDGHPNSQTNPEPEHPLRTLARRVARRLLPLLPMDRVPPRPPSPYAWPPLRDNLAVGWFGAEVPPDPTSGTAFVVRATGGANGDLLVASGGAARPVARSIQNVPAYYVVVLRERGAAFYTASLPGAAGFGAYPAMRPVGIETRGAEPHLYAGVWQGVLGEIGFRVDTRVYGVATARPAGLDRWYGTAHAADRPAGAGPLEGRTAEAGGTWHVATNEAAMDEAATQTTALLDPGTPSGLVHATFVPAGAESYCSVAWRARDASNYWCFEADADGVRLTCVEAGARTLVASALSPPCAAGAPRTLQVLDDGRTFSLFTDGTLAFDRAFADERFGEATGVGVVFAPGHSAGVDAFEAHPRAVPIPPELDLGTPWTPPPGRVVVEDRFAGNAQDLTGRVAPRGGHTWVKVIGKGRIAVEDGCARVCASVAEPNPGRTAYALDWDDPAFADIEVEIVPPGTRQGEGERGRGGIVVWQDARNYFIVNTWLDDVYDGTSISSFFFLDGREDLYRAVWTNAGRRVTWGLPYRLRVATDGVRYLVYVDDEPVLYRALHDVYPSFTRLLIRKVGVAANWEWGDDTGSRFRRFSAKGGPGLISSPAGSL